MQLGIEPWLSQKQYKKTLLELGKESNKIDPLIISTIFGILQKTISTLAKPPVELTEEESYVFQQVCNGKLKKKLIKLSKLPGSNNFFKCKTLPNITIYI